MKHLYLVFGGDTFYPGGGTEDLIDAFTVEDDAGALDLALRASLERKPDWLQVVRFDDAIPTVVFDTRQPLTPKTGD